MVLSCSVLGCKTDEVHKLPKILLHSFPQDEETSKKWCAKLGRLNYKPTAASRICSLHFADHCYRSGTTLRDSAVPTKFFHDWHTAVMAFNVKQKKVVKTDVEFLSDINKELSKLEKPSQFRQPLGDDKNDFVVSKTSPETLKLWGIINKQVYLINKLMSDTRDDNSHKKQLEDLKATQKELERKLETYKYVTKCLQEKQTTLEEQIEILSAVESR